MEIVKKWRDAVKKKFFSCPKFQKLNFFKKINSSRNWDKIYRGKKPTTVFDPEILLFCCIVVVSRSFWYMLDLGLCWAPGFGRGLFGWCWWVFACLLACFYSSFPTPSPPLHSHAVFSLRISFFFIPEYSYYLWLYQHGIISPVSTEIQLRQKNKNQGWYFFWNYWTLFQAFLNKLLGLGFVCFNRAMEILHGEILQEEKQLKEINFFNVETDLMWLVIQVSRKRLYKTYHPWQGDINIYKDIKDIL